MTIEPLIAVEQHAPPGLCVVGLAASAGGLQALRFLTAALAEDFPAAVAVVLHLSPNVPSHMCAILSRESRLPVKQAQHGDRLLAGRVYVAPPDQHLRVRGDRTIELTSSPRQHFVRPSADVMFESMADAFGARAIAVVLSGMGRDGAAGVGAVKRAGGIVIAQDRATAQFFGMPGSAIDTHDVDLVLPLAEIPAALTRLSAVAGAGGGAIA
jgi:two-component system chemotaxis response regulator CheB